MNIYNLHTRNNSRRFWKSALYGLITGIACAVLFSEFVKLTHITFMFFYLLSGYAIAYSIQKAGGGLNVTYSYLGAGLTIFSLLLTHLFIMFGYDILTMPQTWLPCLEQMLKSLFSYSGNSIITLGFMAAGTYIAYHYSNISNN